MMMSKRDKAKEKARREAEKEKQEEIIEQEKSRKTCLWLGLGMQFLQWIIVAVIGFTLIVGWKWLTTGTIIILMIIAVFILYNYLSCMFIWLGTKKKEEAQKTCCCN